MTQTANADAVRLFHESLAADQAGDINQAYQLIIASIAADPTLPGSWYNMGLYLNKLRKYTASAAAFYKSHSLAPDAVLALANYAWSLQLSGRSEEALEIVVDQIIPKDPDNTSHWTNLAQVNLSLNLPARALLAAEKAIELNPKDIKPDTRLVMGLAQLRLWQYAEGFQNFEARMQVNPVLRLLLNHPYPLWRGEDISTKRLYIPCEQGLGDSIMILPFIIAAAKCAKEVIVHTHTPALKFYQRNLTARNIKVFPTPMELPPADYYCPAFSLPIALKLSDAEIPATMHKLRYAPVHFTGLERKDKSELRVGIAWAGDPAHDNDRWRSSSLDVFMRLAEIPNIKLYSLQIGERSKDLDTLGTHGTIKNLAPFIRDANDTAAVIAQHLDVVVCVDTSVGHIAGAVGKKCYTLIGKSAVDWRWGTGEGNSVWYPEHVLMRQEEQGNWLELIERVKANLTNEKDEKC